MLRYIKNHVLAAGLLGTLVPNAQVSAADNRLLLSVYAKAEHNDNVFLVGDDPQKSTSLSVIPSLNYIASTELSSLNLQARARISRYDEAQLDGEDVFLQGNASHQSERSQYSILLRYDRSSNLVSDSNEFALARTRIDRDTAVVTPSYTYSFNRQLSASFFANVTEVDYEDTASGFRDYRTETMGTSLIYDVTERTSTLLSVQAVDYETSSQSAFYDLLSTTVGVEHDFSELVSFEASLGVSDRRSVTTSQPIDFFGTIILPPNVVSETTGTIYSTRLTMKVSERRTVSLNADRSDSSNAFGGLNESESIDLAYNEKISPTRSWQAKLTQSTTDSQTVGVEFSDKTSMSAELSYTDRITRDLSLVGSYRYLTRKFDNSVTGRQEGANLVYFEFRYNFGDLSS